MTPRAPPGIFSSHEWFGEKVAGKLRLARQGSPGMGRAVSFWREMQRVPARASRVFPNVDFKLGERMKKAFFSLCVSTGPIPGTRDPPQGASPGEVRDPPPPRPRGPLLSCLRRSHHLSSLSTERWLVRRVGTEITVLFPAFLDPGSSTVGNSGGWAARFRNKPAS